MTLHRLEGGTSRPLLVRIRTIGFWLFLSVFLLVGVSHPAKAECPPDEVVPIVSGTGDVAGPLVFAGLGAAPEASFFLLGQGDLNNSGYPPAEGWLISVGDLDGDGFSEYRLQAPGEGPEGWGDPVTWGCPATALPPFPPLVVVIYHESEDLDGDGAFDVFEDRNRNGILDEFDLNGDGIITCGPGSFESEDADCDGRLTPRASFGALIGSCEGVLREDFDCDGNLDRIDEDPNRNGRCDPGEPCDVDNDGHWDRGTEDRNGNNRLDDRPFPDQGTLPPGVPSADYPYGATVPTPGGLIVASVAWNGTAYDFDAINSPTRPVTLMDGTAFRIVDAVPLDWLRPDLSGAHPAPDGVQSAHVRFPAIPMQDDVEGTRLIFDRYDVNRTSPFIVCLDGSGVVPEGAYLSLPGDDCPPPDIGSTLTPTLPEGLVEGFTAFRSDGPLSDAVRVVPLSQGSIRFVHRDARHTMPGFTFFEARDNDGDAINQPLDNCPAVSNSIQTDASRNGFGDACDPLLDSTAVIGNHWDLIAPPHSLDNLDSAAAAFDERRGVTVLFGGRASSTWEYGGSSWRLVPTGSAPEPRFGHRMVYDSTRGRVLLFGGSVSGSMEVLDDLWEYDGVDWRLIETAISPPGRVDFGLAYHAARDLVVLFGGEGSGGTLDDTWVFDGDNWRRLVSPQSPVARQRIAMSYDALREEVVMLGGSGSMDDAEDPWEFDGTIWHPVRYSGHMPPTERGVMAYDPSRRQVTLFGADERWQPLPGSPHQLTKRVGVRLYDGLGWTLVPALDSPEPDGERFVGAFDVESETLIAYGLHEEAAYELYRPDDIDGDGIRDRDDNCPAVDNAGQEDEDRDAIGDACDTCVSIANHNQKDLDRDGLGDACDDDIDDDGRLNEDDVCPASFFIGRPPEERLPDGGGPDDDGDGVGNDCDPCRFDSLNDQDDDGVCGDIDNCARAYNPLQEDATGDGAGDACQPVLEVQQIREDGGEVLEVLARAVDPDGDDVRGSIDFIPTQEFTIANQAMDPLTCELGFLPDGVAGEGIIYYVVTGFGSFLIDLDAWASCVDGVEDFIMAPGACTGNSGPFDRTLALTSLTLPALACLRTVGGGGPDRDLLLLERDTDAVHGSLRGGNSVLHIDFSSGLPPVSDISTLSPDSTYFLSLFATDDETPPSSLDKQFRYQAEQVMLITDSFLTASIDTPGLVECNDAQAGRTILDATGSAASGLGDPIVRFDWFRHAGPGQADHLGTGPLLDVVLPLGESRITLEVEDAAGAIAATETVIKVLDTTPPEIVAIPDPSLLWPPNHRMVPVQIDLLAQDACSPHVTVWLESVSSSEPESAAGDIGAVSIGTLDTDLLLRADREASGPGRIYEVTYAATDDLLLKSRASIFIRVPHDLGNLPANTAGKTARNDGG